MCSGGFRSEGLCLTGKTFVFILPSKVRWPFRLNLSRGAIAACKLPDQSVSTFLHGVTLKQPALCHTSHKMFNVGSVEDDTACPSEQRWILNGGRPVVIWSFMPGPQLYPHLKDSLFTMASLYVKIAPTSCLSNFSYFLCEPKFLLRPWLW